MTVTNFLGKHGSAARVGRGALYSTRDFGLTSPPRRASRGPGPAWGPVTLVLMEALAPLGPAASLEWQPMPLGRFVELPVPTTGRPGFTTMPATRTGVFFTNHLSAQAAAENQVRMNGSGVALGDVDGDGWCDLYFCRCQGANALYRNLGGWRFEDITGQAGVACDGQYSTGGVLADVDGDGDLDLLVTSIGGGTRCFLNDGRARFTENNAGLLRKFCGQTMALGDIDGNGTLDLYVANYRSQTMRSTGLKVLRVGERTVLRPEDREAYEITARGAILEHGEPDALYLNDGRGQFTLQAWTDGRFVDAAGRPLTRGDRDWGLSAMFYDLNNDGAPDLYVCNDFHSEDALWLNDGQGRFRAIGKLALRHTPTFSMGVDFADINRDGQTDIFVLDMLSPVHLRRMTQRAMLGSEPAVIGQIDDRPQIDRNSLFLNRGDGTFAEIAQLALVQSTDWSWGCAFLDVDLDGSEDLLVATGHMFDPQDADATARILSEEGRKLPFAQRLLLYPSLNIPNQALRNRGDLTFEDASRAWGFDLVGVTQGLALGDLDGDGDTDVVLNNLNQAASLLRNDSPAPRLAVRLKGGPPNTRGIGANIRVRGGPVFQSQEMVCGGRFLSGDQAQRTFAASAPRPGPAGAAPAADLTIEVTWRSGARSVVTNARPNRLYEIDEASAHPRVGPALPPPTPVPLFQEASARLAHTHHEAPFDDLARQPLLPKRLSQMGPGVAWLDFDADGRDDLLVTSGRGGFLAVFHNRGEAGFVRLGLPLLTEPAPDDQTAVVGWAAPGGARLLLGQSNYEAGFSELPAVWHLELSPRAVNPRRSLPPQPSTPGPLALADVDGDGDLDLFVGGAGLPGRYPAPAASALWRNHGGQFERAQDFDELGLARGAVFSDLDGDGLPELIVACEWGPLRLFQNRAGRFTETDAGLGRYRGFWQGVTAGDFDGDGRLDLAASNWGRNTPYQQSLAGEFRVRYADFTGSGRIDGVESYIVDGQEMPWRDCDTMRTALPWLGERCKTYRAYGEATIANLLADWLSSARELRVNWLDSTLFLNRGGRFEVKPLPVEAQFAPAFGINAADFDGDGREDLFLAQNFFALEPFTPRYDAGRGLLLKGDGRGGFTAMSGQDSGILVYGEQRGSAAGDFDGDGRVDLVVSQNGAATKLYRNNTARPGLRVKLLGTPGNPSAVGAVLRAVNGPTQGPARELHAGSGYCSQDSAVAVLARPVRQLWVRWPGGRTTTTEVPPGATEIALDFKGRLTSSRGAMGRPQ